jgi:hypothetical protein
MVGAAGGFNVLIQCLRGADSPLARVRMSSITSMKRVYVMFPLYELEDIF